MAKAARTRIGGPGIRLSSLTSFTLLCLVAQAGCLQGPRPSPEAQTPDYPRIDLAVGYEVDGAWPVKPLRYEWGAMAAVAVDDQDHIWTLNRGKMPVQVFSTQGQLLDAWGDQVLKTPHGLRIDHDGHIWTADVKDHVIHKFSPKGELLLTIGTPGQPGEDERHLNRPTDIAITPAGDVFISDGYSNNRVVHFDARGRFIKAWGQMGVKPGDFSLPHALALDSQGRLYVCDRNNVRIQVFDQNGIFLAQWRNLVTPWGIWITPGDEIFVCGSSPMRWGERTLGTPPKDQLVMKFDPQGRLWELWTFPPGQTGKEQPGQLNWVHGIAVDSQGNLYQADVQGCRVQKFRRLINR